MHEMSIASALMEQLLRIAEEQAPRGLLKWKYIVA